MLRKIGLFISLLCGIWSAPIHAQWIHIANESSNSGVSLPVGTTWRWGVANCPAGSLSNGVPRPTAGQAWNVSTVSKITKVINPLSMSTNASAFPWKDPCTGTAKGLDVAVGFSQQTITVIDSSGVASPITIPAATNTSCAIPVVLVNNPPPTLSANCAPLPNAVFIANDGASIVGSVQNSPIVFQYCNVGTTTICSQPFIYHYPFDITPDNPVLGGNPAPATGASTTNSLFAIKGTSTDVVRISTTPLVSLTIPAK